MGRAVRGLARSDSQRSARGSTRHNRRCTYDHRHRRPALRPKVSRRHANASHARIAGAGNSGTPQGVDRDTHLSATGRVQVATWARTSRPKRSSPLHRSPSQGPVRVSLVLCQTSLIPSRARLGALQLPARFAEPSRVAVQRHKLAHSLRVAAFALATMGRVDCSRFHVPLSLPALHRASSKPL